MRNRNNGFKNVWLMMSVSFLIMIISNFTAHNSYAGELFHSVKCPETDFAEQSYSRPGMCEYANNISITQSLLGRIDSAQSCTFHWWNYIYGGEKILEIDKKNWIYSLNSSQSPLSVRVRLNPKEFKRGRHDYWIAKGKELLTQMEKESINCKDPQVMADIESLQCPDIGYALNKRKTKTGANCIYKKDIEITSYWIGNITAVESCRDEKFQQYIYEDKSPMEINEELKFLRLYSQTHPAGVTVHLTDKEFKNTRWDFWVDKANEMLRQLEKITFNCKEQMPVLTKPRGIELKPSLGVKDVSASDTKMKTESDPKKPRNRGPRAIME